MLLPWRSLTLSCIFDGIVGNFQRIQMFKTISNKLFSYLSNNTLTSATGVKRKRNGEDSDLNEEQDFDGSFSTVKRRRTEVPNTNTFVNALRTMAQWLKPKSRRYSQEFHILPKQPEVAAASFNGVAIIGSHLTDQKHYLNHRTPLQPNISYTDLFTNGSLEKKTLIHPSSHNGSHLSCEDSIRQHRPSTAAKCIRLKEKEEYQKLLRLHSHPSPWQQPISHGAASHTCSSANESDVSFSSESSLEKHVLQASRLLAGESKTSTVLSSIPKHKMKPNKSSPAPKLNSSGERHVLQASRLMSPETSKSDVQSSIPITRSTVSVSHRWEKSLPAICQPSFSSRREQHRKADQSLSIRRPVEVHADWNLIDARIKVGASRVPLKPDREETEPVVIIDDDDVEENDASGAAQSRSPVINLNKDDGKDTEAHKSTDFRSQVSFLQSRFINDIEIENRRRAEMEERERRKKLIEVEEMKAKAYAEKRRAQEISLDKSLKYQMRIFDDEPQVCVEIFTEEEAEEKLPELTTEMEQIINYALRPGSAAEVLSEAFRLQITRGDIKTLSGLNWLNDEVINFYMNLLMKSGEDGQRAKLYAFNTFFYPKIKSGGHSAVKRWTKSVNIFAMSYIVIPIHLGVHWCLCVVDMNQKVITYYDSMGAPNNQCLHAVLQYLQDESIAKSYTAFKRSEWKLVNAENNPQQMNGGDCGMFMCMYAEYITRGKEITFTQEHMPYFRRRMVYEIISKKLLQ